jgi:hypothetical protein
VQAQRALRGLIHAWHAAREQGRGEIPATVRDPLINEFRHAVLAGLSELPRIPGPKSRTAQRPGRDLLELCRDRQADVTRFCHDTRVSPTNNISERDLRPTKTGSENRLDFPRRRAHVGGQVPHPTIGQHQRMTIRIHSGHSGNRHGRILHQTHPAHRQRAAGS